MWYSSTPYTYHVTDTYLQCNPNCNVLHLKVGHPKSRRTSNNQVSYSTVFLLSQVDFFLNSTKHLLPFCMFPVFPFFSDREVSCVFELSPHWGFVVCTLKIILNFWVNYRTASKLALAVKVIIEKSRGEGSLMEQDTIENVS